LVSFGGGAVVVEVDASIFATPAPVALSRAMAAKNQDR
jgi:hypothetical protein